MRGLSQDMTVLVVDINTPLAQSNSLGTQEKISDRSYF